MLPANQRGGTYEPCGALANQKGGTFQLHGVLTNQKGGTYQPCEVLANQSPACFVRPHGCWGPALGEFEGRRLLEDQRALSRVCPSSGSCSSSVRRCPGSSHQPSIVWGWSHPAEAHVEALQTQLSAGSQCPPPPPTSQ